METSRELTSSAIPGAAEPLWWTRRTGVNAVQWLALISATIGVALVFVAAAVHRDH